MPSRGLQPPVIQNQEMSLASPIIPAQDTFVPPDEESLPPPQPYWSQVLSDTFKHSRPRVGAAWIAILIIFAVLGPFIASSHPFAMKIAGQWSSPLLAHLTPVDVILLVFTLAAAIILPMRAMKFQR